MKNIKKILLKLSCYESPGIVYSYSLDFPHDQFMEILLLPNEKLENISLSLVKTIIESKDITNLSILFMFNDLEKEEKLQRLLDCVENTHLIQTLFLKQLNTVNFPILRLNDLIYHPIDLTLCANSSIVKITLKNSYQEVIFSQFKVDNDLLQGIKTNDLDCILNDRKTLDVLISNKNLKKLSFYTDLDENLAQDTYNDTICDLSISSNRPLHQYHTLLKYFLNLDYFNFTKLQ